MSHREIVVPTSQALDTNWHNYSFWVLAVGSPPKKAFEERVKCTSVYLWVCIFTNLRQKVCTHMYMGGWVGMVTQVHVWVCAESCS